MFRAAKTKNNVPYVQGSPFSGREIVKQKPRSEGILGTFNSARKHALDKTRGSRHSFVTNMDTSSETRFNRALAVISAMKGRKEIEGLLELEDKMLKQVACSVLGNIRDPRSARAIANQVIYSSDGDVRRAAFYALLNYDWNKLEKMDKRKAAEAFRKAITDKELLGIAIETYERYHGIAEEVFGQRQSLEFAEKALSSLGTELIGLMESKEDHFIAAHFARKLMRAMDTIGAKNGLCGQARFQEALGKGSDEMRRQTKILAILLAAKHSVEGDIESLKQMLKGEYETGGSTTKATIERIGRMSFFKSNRVMGYILGEESTVSDTQTLVGMSSPEKMKKEAIAEIDELLSNSYA